MNLSEAEVHALQLLARGPAGDQGSLLQRAAQVLGPVFPGASLVDAEWTREAGEGAEPGQPLDPRTLADAPEGSCYLVDGPSPAGRVVLLCVPPEQSALSPRQRRLLRWVAPWLAAWNVRRASAAELPPVGSAISIDAAGRVLRSDDVADALLVGLSGLRAQLEALYREAAEHLRAERVLEVAERGHLRLRAESPAEDGQCLVALELLVPGSEAMFRARARGLSARELQVARLVLEGWGNRGIGKQLGLASPTVNMYLGGIYQKLGLKNRTELARYLSG